jgi:formiminotetrahydrofolate cyclodeaminase
MSTKLTLTIEKSVIERAKTYAKNTGRSLSELVENYLAIITTIQGEDEKVSNKLSSIIGAVKLPKDFDEDKELLTYFENKHL